VALVRILEALADPSPRNLAAAMEAMPQSTAWDPSHPNPSAEVAWDCGKPGSDGIWKTLSMRVNLSDILTPEGAARFAIKSQQKVLQSAVLKQIAGQWRRSKKPMDLRSSIAACHDPSDENLRRMAEEAIQNRVLPTFLIALGAVAEWGAPPVCRSPETELILLRAYGQVLDDSAHRTAALNAVVYLLGGDLRPTSEAAFRRAVSASFLYRLADLTLLSDRVLIWYVGQCASDPRHFCTGYEQGYSAKGSHPMAPDFVRFLDERPSVKEAVDGHYAVCKTMAS
jgi:hypothetical protein